MLLLFRLPSDPWLTRLGAASGRNVGQPDHVVANPVMRHKAERRPGAAELPLAVAENDGVQVRASPWALYQFYTSVVVSL